MRIKVYLTLFVAFFLMGSLPLFSQEKDQIAAPVSNPFADQFYVPAFQKLDCKITEIRGFSILKTHSRPQNAEYSILTDFGGEVVKSRYLSGLKDPEAIDQYIKRNLQTANFQGVEIRQLPVPDAEGHVMNLYWVGDKSFATPAEATAAIVSMKTAIEAQGGNFAQSVRDAPVYVAPVEVTPSMVIKTPAQFKKEEELVLKFTDQMDIGEKLWGPFQGTPSGEPVLWQSFGDTSWRKTNLAEKNYNSQVGYWTNRVVFKGIRFPFNTIDPFVEETISMDSTSTPYSNNFELFAGLEWYPLMRNAWLQNFQPFGGIPILDWLRNYKLYIKYGDRYAIKDQIEDSRNFDLIWGVQCFYQFGQELPPLDEGRPEKFTDYLRHYVWGEYFGDYSVQKTNFSGEPSFNALIANSSVALGIKLPAIPLPENPINDEMVLMPYLRLEQTSNSSFSFWYQNYFFVAPGIRWMPFRSYRWKENEWLSLFYVYAEWVGIGKDQYLKQNGSPPDKYDTDLRFGVSFSHRRF